MLMVAAFPLDAPRSHGPATLGLGCNVSDYCQTAVRLIAATPKRLTPSSDPFPGRPRPSWVENSWNTARYQRRGLTRSAVVGNVTTRFVVHRLEDSFGVVPSSVLAGPVKHAGHRRRSSVGFVSTQVSPVSSLSCN